MKVLTTGAFVSASVDPFIMMSIRATINIALTIALNHDHRGFLKDGFISEDSNISLYMYKGESLRSINIFASMKLKIRREGNSIFKNLIYTLPRVKAIVTISMSHFLLSKVFRQHPPQHFSSAVCLITLTVFT